MSAPRSIQEKNEYIAKLELLKRNIEEERLRDVMFEQKYPSYGTMMDAFDFASARERENRAVQEAMVNMERAAMQKAYEQSQQGGTSDTLGFNGFAESVDKNIVASNKMNLTEVQQSFLQAIALPTLLDALLIPKAKEIEKPAEIISPLTQQDREILI